VCKTSGFTGEISWHGFCLYNKSKSRKEGELNSQLFVGKSLGENDDY
jgi:hypothetical protein